MTYPSDRTLQLVKPQFRSAFARFVETGEMDASFEEFLNSDADCQAAIEAVATEQLESLRDFGRSLRAGQPEAAHSSPQPAPRAPRVAESDPTVNKLFDMVTAQTSAAPPAQGQELRRALASRLLAEG